MRRRLAEHSGVRARSAAAAGLVVALALAIGGVLLVALLDHSLRSVGESAARAQADQVAAALVGGRDPADSLSDSSPITLVQVLDQGATVLAATTPLAGMAPLVGALPSAAAGDVTVVQG